MVVWVHYEQVSTSFPLVKVIPALSSEKMQHCDNNSTTYHGENVEMSWKHVSLCSEDKHVTEVFAIGGTSEQASRVTLSQVTSVPLPAFPYVTISNHQVSKYHWLVCSFFELRSLFYFRRQTTWYLYYIIRSCTNCFAAVRRQEAPHQ